MSKRAASSGREDGRFATLGTLSDSQMHPGDIDEMRSRRVLCCAVAPLVAVGWGCASARSTPADMPLSCERLLETAPAGTRVPVKDQPRLQNGGELARELAHAYARTPPHAATLQLLVQPDGRASHGCVRRSSGDRAFDQLALRVSVETSRFEPARLNGTAVAAWVAFPVEAVGRRTGLRQQVGRQIT